MSEGTYFLKFLKEQINSGLIVVFYLSSTVSFLVT